MSDATFGTYRDNGDGTFSVTVPVIISGAEWDARTFLARMAIKYAEPVQVQTVANVYFSNYLPTFKRQVEEGDRSQQTLANHMSTWKNVVAPTWSDVLVDEVRPIDVQRWLDKLTLTRARKGVVLLSGIMDVAVRYGMAHTNPLHERYLMPSRKTVSKADKTTWTLAEVEGFCESVHGADFEPYAILLAMGGCRVGEALGVTAGDVRTVNGVTVAHVGRQVRNDGVVTDVLKNQWSVRDVVVPGPLGERLAELAGKQFTPMDQKALRRRWPKTAIAPRNMRPSFQGWMRYELHVQPWVIEKLMGHVTDGVTGTNYDRPLTEQLVEIVAAAWADHDKAVKAA